MSPALVVTVAPRLSTCNKAEQTQPKSHISTDRNVLGLRRKSWPPYVAAIRPSGSVSGREADGASCADATDAGAANPLKLKQEGIVGGSNPAATAEVNFFAIRLYCPGFPKLNEVVTREGSPWIAVSQLGAPSPNHLLRLVVRHKTP